MQVRLTHSCLISNFELAMACRVFHAGSKGSVVHTITRKLRTVNILNVKANTIAFESDLVGEENAIGKNYGIYDMYADKRRDDVNHIEKKLSILENDASDAIRLISQGSEAEQKVALRRAQVNCLRTFLFVMAYRLPSRLAQFKNAAFDSRTKAGVEKFMVEHNLSAFEDVWLQNLSEFVDTPLWLVPVNPKILQFDREDYDEDMRMRRLILWRAEGDEEFIMGTNGNGCAEWYEGVMELTSDDHRLFEALGVGEPTSASAKSKTGVSKHFFIKLYTFTPKVTLAIVSLLLTNPAAVIPNANKIFDATRSAFSKFPFPTAEVTYHGLGPAAKASVSMGKLDEGPEEERILLRELRRGIIPSRRLDGRVLESREDDVLTFPIATLSSAQVRLVNSLMLENTTENITFRSPVALWKSITPSA